MTQSINVLKIGFLICTSLLSISYNNSIPTQDIVESFEKSYNSKDWNTIKELISPDFQIVYQQTNIEVKNVEDFKEKFEWGRIMNSTNRTIIKTASEGAVLTEETYNNDMNRMLNIPAVKLQATYLISQNKIHRVELDTLKFGHSETRKNREIELQNFDEWRRNKHDGTNTIMTEKGAVLLKKQLELYSKSK